MEEDEKTRQTTAEVRQRTLRLSARVKGPDAEVRLGSMLPALTEEGGADNPMGIGVLVPSAGRGAAKIFQPSMRWAPEGIDARSTYPSPTVLVDENIARRL